MIIQECSSILFVSDRCKPYIKLDLSSIESQPKKVMVIVVVVVVFVVVIIVGHKNQTLKFGKN